MAGRGVFRDIVKRMRKEDKICSVCGQIVSGRDLVCPHCSHQLTGGKKRQTVKPDKAPAGVSFFDVILDLLELVVDVIVEIFT